MSDNTHSGLDVTPLSNLFVLAFIGHKFGHNSMFDEEFECASKKAYANFDVGNDVSRTPLALHCSGTMRH